MMKWLLELNATMASPDSNGSGVDSKTGANVSLEKPNSLKKIIGNEGRINVIKCPLK